MKACPALAFSRDPATGAVLINGSSCIGCRYCSWACPYDAPRFDRRRGVMTKCTFCNERLHAGLAAACAAACPTGALTVTSLEESDLTVRSVGLPDGRALRPAVRIVPWDAARGGVGLAGDLLRLGALPSRISVQSEWPLVAFTLAVPTLVALMTARVVNALALAVWPFFGAALLATVLSASHLGRKLGAWRAVLGVRTSWLSREVAGFAAFVALGTVSLAVPPSPPVLDAATLAAGVATLAAIDRVYRVHGIAVTSPGWSLHSASALLTGILLAGMFARSVPVAAAVGAVKVLLYVGRKVSRYGQDRPLRPVVSAMRLGLGFVLPGTLWLSGEAALYWLAVVSVLAGEAVDRGEFYDELEVATPARQMELDLLAAPRDRSPMGEGAA
jgi:DMSO reductase anchor subunit/ferredoxin